MKKTLRLLDFFSIVLLLTGCGVKPQNIVTGETYGDGGQESTETETGINMSDTGAGMSSASEEESENAAHELTDKDITIEFTDKNLKLLQQLELELGMSVAISNTGLDLENRYIMTGKDVDVRDRPRQSGYVLRTLSYQMVNVGTATYSDEGIWVLVSFTCFDESFDNMGWVKVTDLMEYTEENYQMLRYPVRVKEGCVDLETGESVEWDAFMVDYVDDYAHVTREGGRSYNVLPSDIIYPEFINNNSPYNFSHSGD